MQDARHRQREFGDRRIETGPVLTDHLVSAAHRANGRGDRGAAGVLETFTRAQCRLGADYAKSPYFLDLASRVGDDPMPADELCGCIAGIAYRDGVSKDIAIGRLIRLVGEVLGRRADGDVEVLFLAH